MSIDTRLELSRLASARQEIGEIVAVVESTPAVALERLRAWRSEHDGLADEAGELGSLVALAAILEQLVTWGAALRAAETDAARYLKAAQVEAELRLRRASADDAHALAVRAFLQATMDVTRYTDLQQVAYRFVQVPLRSSLTAKKSDRGTREPQRRTEPDAPRPVVDLAVSINGGPWIGPQLLRRDRAYQVTVRAALSRQPSDLDALVVSGVSSLGPEVLTWPDVTFTSDELSAGTPRTITLIGRATTDYSIRHEVRLNARVRTKQGESAIATIGMRSVRPVITDRAAPAVANEDMPQYFFDVLRDVERHARPDPDHWSDFQHLLRASINFRASTLVGGTYRDTTDRDEREFQADVRTFLHAQLGVDDVIEAEKAGGGQFDLRYRTVPNELKVERDTSDLAAIAAKYSAQTSQYAAVRGRQLAVMTVLDVTKKTEPLADAANYVRVIDRIPAAAAGLDDPIPLVTAVVVVPANYMRPSDLK